MVWYEQLWSAEKHPSPKWRGGEEANSGAWSSEDTVFFGLLHPETSCTWEHQVSKPSVPTRELLTMQREYRRTDKQSSGMLYPGWEEAVSRLSLHQYVCKMRAHDSHWGLFLALGYKSPREIFTNTTSVGTLGRVTGIRKGRLIALSSDTKQASLRNAGHWGGTKVQQQQQDTWGGPHTPARGGKHARNTMTTLILAQD